nr:hypothetical protein [uncultured Roseovarius sp.]
MTYTPDSYTRAVAAVNTITNAVSSKAEQAERAMKVLIDIEASLGDMAQPAPTGWLDAITYINQQAAANPEDAEWQNLKGQANKIVSDFQTRKSQLAAINAAIAEV